MTYPSIVTQASYGTTTTTSHVVSMPASLVAGNLLLLIYTADAHVSEPSGWTECARRSGSGAASGVLARISDGTESSVTLTSGGSNALAATVYQIDNWYGTITGGVTVGSNATGTGNSANPPTVTHGLGTQETLFIAVCGTSANNAPMSSYPSGYALGIAGTPGCNHVTAKQATSNTDDPSNFGIGVITGWSAFAVAVVSSSAAARARRQIYLP